MHVISFQAQMPSRIATEEGVKCSYLSICDMDDVTAVSEELKASDVIEHPNSACNLVNAYVNATTISKYQSLTNDELTFQPSSLTFEITCLFENGHIQVSHLGLQRKVTI